MRTPQPPTEREALIALKRGELGLSPLSIGRVVLQPSVRSRGRIREPDAFVDTSWEGKSYRFAVEYTSHYTLKAIAEAAERARRMAQGSECFPMIFVPFLNEEAAQFLLDQKVSGIDLCGNRIVQVPGELLIYRTGAPNRFRRSGAIKNVYRRNSSMVARVFLSVPEFASVGDAWKEAERRGARITLATVSKVCAALDADLIVERRCDPGTKNRQLRLIQPGKLLDLLAENYSPPEIADTWVGKYASGPNQLRQALEEWQRETGGRIIRTGASSVEAYAVMAREPIETFYCSDVPSLLEWLGSAAQPGDRFPNLRLMDTADNFVYFDARPAFTAAPVQTFLELAIGDKRDRETAEQVRRVILTSLRPRSEGLADGRPVDQPA